MKLPSVSHLDDGALTIALKAAACHERGATAVVVVHIAEFDARHLYAPAGYSSMHAYCVEELKFSEDAAYKRIQAARAAREFPAIFEALADGRLHLTGIGLLAPYLTVANAEGLLAAAAYRSKEGIKRLLAERFPRSETLPLVQTVPAQSPSRLQASKAGANVMEWSDPLAPAQVGTRAPRSNVEPIAAQRYTVPLSFGQSTWEKLQYAQDLLGHSLSTEEIEAVFGRGLDVRIAELEKQKFAATDRPAPGRARGSSNARYIPKPVRRAVWARDGGRCTFVSDSGHRCGCRRHLQYDHIIAIALGGESTVENLRLRCRAHNQLEADRVFGTAFMDGKRAAGRQATAGRAAARAQLAPRQVESKTVTRADPLVPAPIEIDSEELMNRDLKAALRRLGYRAAEVQERVAWCASMPPEATLEDRVRAALRGPRYAPVQRGGTISPAL